MNLEIDLIEYLERKGDFEKYNLSREFDLDFSIGSRKVRVVKNKKSGSEQKKRLFKGYAATKDKDRVDDIITIEALKRARNDLLSSGSRTVFFNHERNMPIGKVISSDIDSKGLLVEVEVSRSKDVDNIWEKIKDGTLSSLSIGGRFKKVRIERDEEGRIISFKVLEIELMEVSVVGLPANPKASITSVTEKFFKSLIREEEKMKKEEKDKKQKDKEQEEKEQKEKEMAEKNKQKESFVTKKELDDFGKSILGTLSELSKSLKELKEDPKEDPKKEPKEDPKKGQEEDVVLKAVTDLQSELKTLKEDLNRQPSRKGILPDEDDDDEEVNIDKILKDKDSPESAAFAKMAMNDVDGIYNELSDAQKKTVDSIYFKLLTKAGQKRG